ncbi:MAG: hypothetical protein GXY70_03610 [Euryarchaeota archaeon]|nr:hypothetical protein [Euryarchaeota archaeon]
MKKGWIAMVVAGAVVGVLLVYSLLGGLVQSPSGFDEGDLNAPLIDTIVRDEGYPGPLGVVNYPVQVQYFVNYGRTVYSDFGGVMELTVENQGWNDIYVHHYFVAWDDGNESFGVNSSRLIPSGETAGLGILHFPGPGESGVATLEIGLEMWTSSASGELWDDKGEMSVDSLTFVVVEEDPLRDWEVERNPLQYYDKVNGLIDLEVVSPFVQEVRYSVPGDYSLLQVIEAYELVSSNIAYADDEDNHWQSPSETISLGSGDCEDHSLLLASLITALGGTCRVNIIAGHAFPTVYVGNSSVIDDVVNAIHAYYGNPVPVHYTVDDLGYWLLIDTNGMPYIGGYPAAASPAGGLGGTNWHFDDGDWIKLVDVTGETVGGLF